MEEQEAEAQASELLMCHVLLTSVDLVAVEEARP